MGSSGLKSGLGTFASFESSLLLYLRLKNLKFSRIWLRKMKVFGGGVESLSPSTRFDCRKSIS